MNQDKKAENRRASRICNRIIQHHILLDNIYELLVDRNFITVKKDIDVLILELRGLIKSSVDDDF
jgi:hypothetical protein